MSKGVSEKRYNQLDGWARENWEKPTKAEEKLWGLLRKRWWNTWQFQCVRDHYILDFYSKKHKTAIEVDGTFHADRADYDRKRTETLRRDHGIRILRFTNEQVLNDPDKVMETIETALGEYSRYARKRKLGCIVNS